MLKKTNRVGQSKKHTLIGAVIVMILGLYDLSGIGGNAHFSIKWMQCGERPVVGHGSGLMNADKPYYSDSATVALMRLSPDYFCSPLEAERAGYSASRHQFDFPAMKAAGEYPNRQ